MTTRPAAAILADLAPLLRELADALEAHAAAPARPVDAPAEPETSYVTPSEAARLMGVSVRTLAAHRAAGTGPLFMRVGRCVRYPFGKGFNRPIVGRTK